MNIIYIIILLVAVAERITGRNKTNDTITDQTGTRIDDPASVRLR